MSDLHEIIAERIQAKGPGPFWMLDCLLDLIERGISRDDALDAIRNFTDELIARKKRKVGRLR